MRYPVQENPPEKEKCPQPWLSAVQRHNDAKLRMLHIQYSSRIDTHLINIVILRHIKMTLQLCEAFQCLFSSLFYGCKFTVRFISTLSSTNSSTNCTSKMTMPLLRNTSSQKLSIRTFMTEDLLQDCCSRLLLIYIAP